MASCKDCLHYEVCSKMNANCDRAAHCEMFKDRSKFVDLPCCVGDTVYSIKNNHINECKVVWIKIATKSSIEIRLNTKDFTFYDVSPKDFGKTVFLTKEKAEKALEERNA